MRVASRFSSSSTTLRTTARAVSLVVSGIALLSESRVPDQMHVRLHGLQHLRLQQQRGQAEPVDGVALHDLDDGGGEVRTDVAEPARHVGRGAAEPRRTPAAAPAAVRGPPAP